jgi:hypothetical protein
LVTIRTNDAPVRFADSVRASSCQVRRPLSATFVPSAQISKIAVPWFGSGRGSRSSSMPTSTVSALHFAAT